MEDVVAQDKTCSVIANELLANDECLRQAIGRRLLGILKAYTIVTAIAKQALEARQVLRCGDDEYLPYSGKHEHRNGIIYHRLVIYWKHLLAYSLGYRIETGSRSTGKNYSFHKVMY